MVMIYISFSDDILYGKPPECLARNKRIVRQSTVAHAKNGISSRCSFTFAAQFTMFAQWSCRGPKRDSTWPSSGAAREALPQRGVWPRRASRLSCLRRRNCPGRRSAPAGLFPRCFVGFPTRRRELSRNSAPAPRYISWIRISISISPETYPSYP